MPFAEILSRDAEAIGVFLDAVLAKEADNPLRDALRYAVAGGKRLRGFLVMEGARMHGLEGRTALPAAAAIEAIHAYSLVHDDLPCMDDDDLRRGRPTVHRKWDEGTAVLVGDALQSLGFELLLDETCHPDPAIRADLALTLARASGWRGMVMGQAMDMAAESATEQLSLDQITVLQAGKTGALIVWSAQAGARLAGAPTGPLASYAEALGLAFQIADDILDIEGEEQSVGKAVGKDAVKGKATFVSCLGVDGAKRRADELVTEACDALSSYGEKAETLKQAARFVISRDS